MEGPSFSLGTHHSQSHSVCCKKGETILPSRHIGATPCVTPHPLNLPFSGGKGYLLPRQGGQPLWKVHLYPLEGRTSAAKGPWEWTLAKQSWTRWRARRRISMGRNSRASGYLAEAKAWWSIEAEGHRPCGSYHLGSGGQWLEDRSDCCDGHWSCGRTRSHTGGIFIRVKIYRRVCLLRLGITPDHPGSKGVPVARVNPVGMPLAVPAGGTPSPLGSSPTTNSSSAR